MEWEEMVPLKEYPMMPVHTFRIGGDSGVYFKVRSAHVHLSATRWS
jgi:hypothetical protein